MLEKPIKNIDLKLPFLFFLKSDINIFSSLVTEKHT